MQTRPPDDFPACEGNALTRNAIRLSSQACSRGLGNGINKGSGSGEAEEVSNLVQPSVSRDGKGMRN